MKIIDNNWFAKDNAITSGGCPSAPTRLTTLPLETRYIFLPTILKQSMPGLRLAGALSWE